MGTSLSKSNSFAVDVKSDLEKAKIIMPNDHLRKILMIKLLILDLDGVILDTEKNMIKSWEEVRKKYHIKKNLRITVHWITIFKNLKNLR